MTASTTKSTATAVEAARRKFTPEFMNRIDKVVVFKTLRSEHLEANSRNRTRYGAAAGAHGFRREPIRFFMHAQGEGLPFFKKEPTRATVLVT